MFRLLCEFFVISKYDELNYKFVLKKITMYFKVQIIWNNHEIGVLMNGKVKCVDNPRRNSECMHVKCKFVVIVVWNNYVWIKFTFTTNFLILIVHLKLICVVLILQLVSCNWKLKLSSFMHLLFQTWV
jgi:hypothetical protein